jgi:phenylacetate-coenzyme A ligase PaaK-like adenylate-forming protein
MTYWNAELETKPWPDVERWQAAQVAAAVPRIRHASRLYARLHANLPDAAPATLADLQALPFTFKDDLRAAQEAADDDAPFGDNQAVPHEQVVQAIASSGTTGSPLYYAMTRADTEACADAIANVWFTAGLRSGDTVAHLVGLPMVAGGLPYADGFRRLGATLCWLGGFPTDRILREMRRLRVTAMLSTTSFALHLAEQWEAAGRETGLPSRLRTVLGGGEPGMQQREVRARILAGLGLRHVRDSMGLGDVMPSMWSECEAEDGMHFNAQRYVAVELVQPESGERVEWAEGVTGELVYTTFAREAMPVVRYRSRDHAQVVAMRCACGRTSPRIRCIGRTDDMLIYKGMNVFPSAVRDLVGRHFAGRAAPLLRIWKDRADQVRFDTPIPVEVEAAVALDPDEARALAGEIEALARSQLQARLAVTMLPPGALPRSMYKQSLVAVRPAPEST